MTDITDAWAVAVTAARVVSSVMTAPTMTEVVAYREAQDKIRTIIPTTILAADARIKALAAENARMREALEEGELWQTAALECKGWSWDFDQHDAATSSRNKARAALAPQQPGDEA